ncbi:MAG: SusD/RagB family nutrient-binding outer membrane lipoprotein [Niabella sp.]
MKLKYIFYITTLTAVLFSAGCSRDFGDINQDPTRVTEATIPSLITSLESNINGRDFTFLAIELDYPASQLFAKVRDIGVDPIDRTSNAAWAGYYSFLADYRKLEETFENYPSNQDRLVNVKAIAKTLAAFRTMNNLDVYGDMPYAGAGYAFVSSNQIFRPVYDKQADIYSAVLTDLKWASDNYTTATLNGSGEAIVSPGANDVFYAGAIAKWQKLTNSLLLKTAIKIYDKDAATASPIIADLLNNNKPLLVDGEDWKIAPSTTGTNRSFQPSFRAANSCGARMGNTIWNLLSSSTTLADTSGANIFDYRAKVFFEKNAYGSWYPAPQNTIVTDDFGDVYVNGRRNNPANNRSRYSAINIFLVTDNVNVPDIYLTAAEVYFLKAEAYARGMGVSKNWATAETNYKAGIASSVNFWSAVGQSLQLWAAGTGKPAAATATDISTIQNNSKVMFLGTDSEAQKLSKIYAQHWLSLFWQPWDAYYLMRRTLQTPQTVAYNSDYYRVIYPQAEIGDNKTNYDAAVAAMGGDTKSIKLWWMK